MSLIIVKSEYVCENITDMPSRITLNDFKIYLQLTSWEIWPIIINY